MAKLDPAIRHAITPLAFDENKLHRERLVDAIHAEIGRKLIVIAAPAGYGKTVLLSDFTAHTEVPICWVRLTEPAGDHIRLAALVIASLTRRFRRLNSVLSIERLRNSSPVEAGSTIAARISESVGEAFAILIDDVHLLQGKTSSIYFLDRLVLASPEQVTFILSGRQVIELSLARVMAEGNLVGFGPSQLALNREELLQLSEIWGGILAGDHEAEELLNTTQGWAAGILLSSTFARHRLKVPNLDDHALVYDYLASATLNRLQSDLREFLLESSLIPIMTAQACDRVLGGDNSQVKLEKVAASGLFVTWTDEDPRTYEYHPLFRDFLVETLRASNPSRFGELVEQAGEYLNEQGDFESAVGLYMRAGLYESALEVMEQSSSIAGDRGWLSTLEDWEESLRNIGFSLPVLGLDIAKCLIARGNLDLAKERLEKLELPPDLALQLDRLQRLVYVHLTMGDMISAEESYSQLESHASNIRDETLGRKYRAICQRFDALLKMRSSVDWESALVSASNAVDEFASIPGQESNLTAALHTKSTILSGMARFREALSTENRAWETQMDRVSPVQLATTLNNLGFLYHQIGNFEQALQTYSEALTEARRGGSERMEAFVVLGQADLFNDLGLIRQAGELYERGLELSVRLNIQGLISHSCLMTAVLHRRRTTHNVAVTWIQRAIELGANSSEASLRFRVERAALEYSSNWEKGSRVLEAATREGGDRPTTPLAEHVLAGYLLSQGLFRRGEREPALDQFRQLLRQVSRGETHQVVASELIADGDFLEFVKKKVATDPAFQIIESRIIQMKAMTERFLGPSLDAEAEGKGLQIRALGRLRIMISNREVSSDLKPQAKELLVFLADRGSTDREELAERFWSGHSQGRQIANLHMAVYSLRNVLGKESISLEGVSYSISLGASLAYDVAEFERAAHVAERLPIGDPRRLFALNEALRLYPGVFLVEFDSDWVLERRRLLELRYLDLIAAHAEEKLMRNEPREALERLREALELEPLRDDINAHYLEALGQLDQRSEAVRHYKRYSYLLLAELGLEPSDQVKNIYQKLVR